MTFTEFQQSRRWSDDLAKDAPDFVDDGWNVSGWLYHGALVIEEVKADWPNRARDQGQWHLIICNLEWIGDDLTDLERKLYDYACDEGIAWH